MSTVNLYDVLDVESDCSKKDIIRAYRNLVKKFHPDKYKDDDYVIAYRRYYINDKKSFAKWEKGRKQPKWWVD